jgi:DNA-binding transcriptional LysR family regulator
VARGATPPWAALRVVALPASLQEVLTLIAAGRGVCLVPAPVADHHPRAEVRYVPVTDSDPAIVSLAWRPNDATPELRAFVATAASVAAQVVAR